MATLANTGNSTDQDDRIIRLDVDSPWVDQLSQEQVWSGKPVLLVNFSTDNCVSIRNALDRLSYRENGGGHQTIPIVWLLGDRREISTKEEQRLNQAGIVVFKQESRLDAFIEKAFRTPPGPDTFVMGVDARPPFQRQAGRLLKPGETGEQARQELARYFEHLTASKKAAMSGEEE